MLCIHVYYILTSLLFSLMALGDTASISLQGNTQQPIYRTLTFNRLQHLLLENKILIIIVHIQCNHVRIVLTSHIHVHVHVHAHVHIEINVYSTLAYVHIQVHVQGTRYTLTRHT